MLLEVDILGMSKELEAVIGLEIHSELKTATKMFCFSKNDPDEKHPNVNVCPVCLGHPGTLPVINQKATELVQRVGAALQCKLAEFSKFDRKNYFYPDLPKGYQISQYDLPLCGEGHLDILPQGANAPRKIRIERIHLEEDTGRLLHPENSKESLVDFNRAGMPLMELVTKPDIRSGKEARAFAEELQLILQYLGASDANMEKGQMRIEVNLSLREKGVEQLGTKVEVKNLNSFRSVERAVEFEIERQKAILEEGGRVIQETRGWHDVKQITFSQRQKEEAHDYRYFPEPDLPPMRFAHDYFENLKAMLPELPVSRRNRFIAEYIISPKEAEVLVVDKKMGEYFEEMVSELQAWYGAEGKDFEQNKLIKLASSYLLSDLRGIMSEKLAVIEDLRITPEDFAELIKLIAQDKISSRAAKDVLLEMFETGADPHEIIKAKDIGQTGDEEFLGKETDKVLAENPKAVEDFKTGKPNAMQFLIGKVMMATKGRANPKVVKELLDKKINNL